MPIYEYECRKCKAHVEILQKMTDKPLSKCRKCGGKLEKQWSATSFQLKGTGWYVTDYAAKKKSGGEEKKAGAAETTTSTDAANTTAATTTTAPPANGDNSKAAEKSPAQKKGATKTSSPGKSGGVD